MTILQPNDRKYDHMAVVRFFCSSLYEKLKDVMTTEKPDKNGEILTVNIYQWLWSYDRNGF